MGYATLVLVNYGGGTGQQAYELAKLIQKDVMTHFGIQLIPEAYNMGDCSIREIETVAIEIYICSFLGPVTRILQFAGSFHLCINFLNLDERTHFFQKMLSLFRTHIKHHVTLSEGNGPYDSSDVVLPLWVYLLL